MSKFTNATVKAFSRIAADAEKPAIQGAFADACGALCVCDGFMVARLFDAANAPELAEVPRVSADPVHARLLAVFDKIKSTDYTLAASTARADYHGAKPVLYPDELRRFSRWSVQDNGNDYFPVGDGVVSASRLARLLAIVPDASIYAREKEPFAPVYLRGASGDAVLLPCRIASTAAQREERAAYFRARFDTWRTLQPSADPVPASASLPALCPSSPSCILEAVHSTSETPVKVIGYKRDGNTVCVHRVQAHHVADNIYVYASRADQYGNFAWRFVSLFVCGYALELDCLPDNVSYCDDPTSNGHCTEFGGRSLVDFLRALNAVFADDAAFLSCINACMNTNTHIQLSFVRMLQEMGNQGELISRVMSYRQQRAKAIEKAEAEKAAARVEAEKQEEQQRQQEHAQALAECRTALLSDGERKPIDGAILCDLAASLGVSVSFKLKGWIMNKLATATIEDGKMVMYQYNRQKKTEKGSNAFWPFMHALMDALHQQEKASEEKQQETATQADLDYLFGVGNAPKVENQARNLELTQEHKQDTTQDHNAHNAPELGNQSQNPSLYILNGRTLPETFAHAQQITMQDLLNTS